MSKTKIGFFPETRTIRKKVFFFSFLPRNPEKSKFDLNLQKTVLFAASHKKSGLACFYAFKYLSPKSPIVVTAAAVVVSAFVIDVAVVVIAVVVPLTLLPLCLWLLMLLLLLQ